MWTVTKITSETARSGRAAHGLVLALIVVLLLGAGLFESRTVASIDRGYRDWLDAGGMLFSIEGSDAGIIGERCDRLSNHPFVLLSGGAGQASAPSEEIAFTKSPDVQFPIVRMTAGAAAIAGSTNPAEFGVTLGPAIASELGINGLDNIALEQAVTQVHVLSTDNRELGYDRSVLYLVPGSTTRFAVCWVELEPSTYPDGADLLAAQFSEPTQIRPFVRLDDSNHASVRFAERPSQHAWLPTGILVALVWFSWWWTRRRELILYQSLHIGRSGLFLLAMLEAAAITAAASGIAVVGTIQFSDRQFAGLNEGAWTVLVSALTGLLAAAVFAAFFAQRNIATGTKDF